jgi:hypothetical protein
MLLPRCGCVAVRRTDGREGIGSLKRTLLGREVLLDCTNLVQRDERPVLLDADLCLCVRPPRHLYSLMPATISSTELIPWSSGLIAKSDAIRPLALRLSNPGGGV